MLEQIKQYLTPLRMLQYLIAYLMFILIAYHKVIMSRLGIGATDTSSAVIATRDFWHQPIVERIGFAIIWGTMGMLAVAFIWLMVNGLNELKNARSLTRDYANVKAGSTEIYKETAKRILAGFSPLIIFPICASTLLPLSYRLLYDLSMGISGGSVLKALASMLIGVSAIALLGASTKLVRTAFA